MFADLKKHGLNLKGTLLRHFIRLSPLAEVGRAADHHPGIRRAGSRAQPQWALADCDCLDCAGYRIARSWEDD